MNDLRTSKEIATAYDDELIKHHHVIAYNSLRKCLCVWQCESMAESRIVMNNLSGFRMLSYHTIVYNGQNPLTYLTRLYDNVLYVTKDLRESWYYPKYQGILATK